MTTALATILLKPSPPARSNGDLKVISKAQVSRL